VIDDVIITSHLSG